MTEPPVRLVLDTSAILEFARGSVHVGEVLAELTDSQAAAALPVACLAEAVPLALERERLDALVTHEATVLLTDDAEEWSALGHMCAVTGEFSAASVALAAIDFQAWILTARPGLYAQVANGEMVVAIED